MHVLTIAGVPVSCRVAPETGILSRFGGAHIRFRAHSSVGQSASLITTRSQVRVLVGPFHTTHAERKSQRTNRWWQFGSSGFITSQRVLSCDSVLGLVFTPCAHS